MEAATVQAAARTRKGTDVVTLQAAAMEAACAVFHRKRPLPKSVGYRKRVYASLS